MIGNDELTGSEVVDQHWPYDGPHSAETVTNAASALSALVRYLNNATGPGNGRQSLRYAPHIYRTLGNLHSAVGGLDQLLGQLVGELERIAEDPSAYDDRRGTDAHEGTDVTARSAAHKLSVARRPLASLREYVSDAWQQTSHLGHDLGSDDDSANEG